MLQLYSLPGAASMTPHMLLEELGMAYEIKTINQDGGELDSPAFRKLNPNGHVPVLVDGDLVLIETAAICLYLSDGAGRLMPPVGSRERAVAYRWLSWLSTTLQPTLVAYFYPHRFAETEDAIAQVKAQAEKKVVALLAQIDSQLASHDQPWLLGAEFMLVDLYAMMLCRWTRNFASKPARTFAHIAPWLQRVLARPAVGRVFAQQGLQQPWV